MRLFGHPVHPILVAFPLALLALAPICDLVAWLNLAPKLALVGYYLELFGLAGGGLAAVTGFVDFYELSSPSPALGKAALTHAALALSTLSLFGLAFALRTDANAGPTPVALVLELVGSAAIGVTGWFGGHLVFAFGVGVTPRAAESANLDAPRPETAEPASRRKPLEDQAVP